MSEERNQEPGVFVPGWVWWKRCLLQFIAAMAIAAVGFLAARIAGFDTGDGLHAIVLIGLGLIVFLLSSSLLRSEWLAEVEASGDQPAWRASWASAGGSSRKRWLRGLTMQPFAMAGVQLASLVYGAMLPRILPERLAQGMVPACFGIGSLAQVLVPPLYRLYGRKTHRIAGIGR